MLAKQRSAWPSAVSGIVPSALMPSCPEVTTSRRAKASTPWA